MAHDGVERSGFTWTRLKPLAALLTLGAKDRPSETLEKRLPAPHPSPSANTACPVFSTYREACPWRRSSPVPDPLLYSELSLVSLSLKRKHIKEKLECSLFFK